MLLKQCYLSALLLVHYSSVKLPDCLQLATSDMVYLFDAYTMGHACISYGLDRILSSPTILKVGQTHTVRYDDTRISYYTLILLKFVILYSIIIVNP